MRILFIAHRTPYPPNKGDKIRSFNILSHLLRNNEVWLATLVDTAEDMQSVDTLQKRVKKLLYARIDQPGRRVLALRSIIRSRPITVRYFYSKRLQAQIDDLAAEVDFDAVVCSSSPMAEYLFKSKHLRGRLSSSLKVMDLIDVDSYKWRQYAERSPPWKAWIFRHESRSLAAYERRIASTFDTLLVVTEREKLYFPDGPKRATLEAVANGVDLDYFKPGHARRISTENRALVFTGMMDYWPNVEGMQWFIDEVYPSVRKALPQVSLFIVGNRPSSTVRKWASIDGVVVTGFVPDVRDYLAAADVCIAPLRIARGIQNKVLESMAMGKAVVSTPEAFEGIEATPGEDLEVTSDAETFASTILRLLRDQNEAARLGANARRFVERQFSWEHNLRSLDEILARGSAPERGTANAARCEE